MSEHRLCYRSIGRLGTRSQTVKVYTYPIILNAKSQYWVIEAILCLCDRNIPSFGAQKWHEIETLPFFLLWNFCLLLLCCSFFVSGYQIDVILFQIWQSYFPKQEKGGPFYCKVILPDKIEIQKGIKIVLQISCLALHCYFCRRCRCCYCSYSGNSWGWCT